MAQCETCSGARTAASSFFGLPRAGVPYTGFATHATLAVVSATMLGYTECRPSEVSRMFSILVLVLSTGCTSNETDDSVPSTQDDTSPAGDSAVGPHDSGSDTAPGGDSTLPPDTEAPPIETGGTETGSADTGEPPEPSPYAKWVGRTWKIDMAGSTIVEPADVGSVLQPYLEDRVMISVHTATAKGLDLLWGYEEEGSSGVQDLCRKTTLVEGATFDGANLAYATPTLAIDVAEIAVQAEQVGLSAEVQTDGSAIQDASLAYLLDTSNLGMLVDEKDPEAICDLLRGFGLSCQACASGAITCLPLYIDHITGDRVDGTSLVEVTEDCP